MSAPLLMEEVRTLFAGLALVFSLISLWWSWRTWRESSRPIVSVQVESVDDRDGPVTFKLIVTNSGTRPAFNIRLTVEERNLLASLSPDAESTPEKASLVAGVKRCFSADAAIPVLLPNKSTSNSFGYSGTPKIGGFWKYGSSMEVTLEYADIPGHRYRTRMPIVLRDTMGFAGSHWKNGETLKAL